ncbi:hypothetical protein Pyn_09047 [Prunus yedoensis var. nudiflora]|uniref:Uncharacterized protein n=1 Tax=Prunus yedoensis var. nudiflora TaxID=2094558 RepID=A0A314Z6E6_PRUYE|nr:hypothetical protein Pyn_09047 [Prunus yedoensis var. nudiflora]
MTVDFLQLLLQSRFVLHYRLKVIQVFKLDISKLKQWIFTLSQPKRKSTESNGDQGMCSDSIFSSPKPFVGASTFYTEDCIA